MTGVSRAIAPRSTASTPRPTADPRSPGAPGRPTPPGSGRRPPIAPASDPFPLVARDPTGGSRVPRDPTGGFPAGGPLPPRDRTGGDLAPRDPRDPTGGGRIPRDPTGGGRIPRDPTGGGLAPRDPRDPTGGGLAPRDPRDPTGGGRIPRDPTGGGRIPRDPTGGGRAFPDPTGGPPAPGAFPARAEPPLPPRDNTGGGRVMRDPTGGGHFVGSDPSGGGRMVRDPTGGGQVPTASYEPGGPGQPPGADRTAQRVAGTAAGGAEPHEPRRGGGGYGGNRPYEDDYSDEDYDDEDLYEDDSDGADGRPSRRRRVVLGILLVMVLALAATAFVGWRWWSDQVDPPGEPGETVSVEIPAGTSTAQIGDWLEEGGVITSATVWNVYTRLNDPGTIQAGTYDLRRNSSMEEVIAALQDGPAAPEGRYVTIPEGFTVAQTVERIADPEDGIDGFTAEAVQAVIDGNTVRSAYLPQGETNPEGTLFPETYRLEEGQDEAALVGQMVAEFDAVAAELAIEEKAAALGLSPYEAIVVASLIEEETQVDAERARVAGVIYNRLETGEPLGIDATTCYPLGLPSCTPTAEQLESDSPYNTRINPDLPPTPISSPGRASLEAALNPEPHDYLFYVRTEEDGSHTFSETNEEHNAAVEVCRERGYC